MKRRNIATLILSVIMLLSLCACGAEPKTPGEVSLETLRKTAADKTFAIAYLGGTAEEINADGVRELVKASGMTEDNAFLEDIADDHIIMLGGCDLYCIVPVNAGDKLSVSEVSLADDGTLRPGDVVYEGDGAPILLLCNVSDIMPNALVTVGAGESAVSFSPYLSLMDGSLAVTEAEDQMYSFSAAQ